MHDGVFYYFRNFKGSKASAPQVKAGGSQVGHARLSQVSQDTCALTPLTQPSLANLELNLSSLWTTA